MTGAQTGRWRMAVDFGTSNTAAALVRDDDGRVRVVRLERDSDAMPSAVIVGDETQPSLAGRPAINAMQVAPPRFIAHPKLALGGSTVLIGGRMYRAVSLAALVLTVVRQKAMRMMDDVPPAEVVLTHPVAWGDQRIGSLVEAAVKAGFDPQTIRTVSEPVAAAHLYGRDQPPAPGERIGVFDFGGGTLDIAIVERDLAQATGYEVIGHDGDEHLGGKDFDDLLLQWVLQRLRESHGADAVAAVQDPANLRQRLTLLQSVTAAKEDLSESQSASIPVSFPGIDTVLTVTRGEYEGIIQPDIDRAVSLVRRLISLTRTERLDRLYLTGGSSRTPVLHQALIDAVGIRPSTLFDPKLVVAEGALWTPGAADPGTPPAAADPPATEGADAPPPPPEAPVVTPTHEPSPQPAPIASPPLAPAPVQPPPGTAPRITPRPPIPAPPRRPRAALVVWIVVGAVSLLVLAGIVIGAIALSGAGSPEGRSSSSPEAPVDESVLCWDGSSSPASDACPPLEGREALLWAFQLDGEPECTDRTTEYISGAVEGVECVWEDLGQSTIVNITRFDDGESQDAWAAVYADSDGAELVEWTNDDESVGTSWVVIGGTDGPQERATTLIYDDLPITLDVWTRPSADGTEETHETALERVHGLTLDEIAAAAAVAS